MTFPVVEATNTSSENTGTTSHGVDLPASIAAGETLIVIFGLEGQVSITWPGGWTQFFLQDTDVPSDRRLACAWRKATGAEGSSITVTTGASDRSHHQSYRISGAEDPTIQPPEGSAGVLGEGTTPDPDSLTPTGGAKDYLWLAIAVTGGDGSFSAAPSSYTNLLDGGISGNYVTPASARRNLNAASEDPGTFLLPSAYRWCAGTLAVHPAPSAIEINVTPVSMSLVALAPGTGLGMAPAVVRVIGIAPAVGSVVGAAVVRLLAITPTVDTGGINVSPVILALIGVPPRTLAWADYGVIEREIDVADYTDEQFFFEVTLQTNDASRPAHARIFNVTDGVAVTDSDIQSVSTSPERVRSGALALSGEKIYKVQFGIEA